MKSGRVLIKNNTFFNRHWLPVCFKSCRSNSRQSIQWSRYWQNRLWLAYDVWSHNYVLQHSDVCCRKHLQYAVFCQSPPRGRISICRHRHDFSLIFTKKISEKYFTRLEFLDKSSENVWLFFKKNNDFFDPTKTQSCHYNLTVTIHTVLFIIFF